MCWITTCIVKISATWTNDETQKLITSWGEHGIQEQLEGLKRTKHAYENQSGALMKESVSKSGEQYRTKVKTLLQD